MIKMKAKALNFGSSFIIADVKKESPLSLADFETILGAVVAVVITSVSATSATKTVVSTIMIRVEAAIAVMIIAEER